MLGGFFMNIKAEKNIVEPNKGILPIIKGTIISVVISMILLLIFSIILTYTNISEATIVPIIIVVTTISILIGSSIGSAKIKKNGLLNGAIIGGIYMIIFYILSSIVSWKFALNTTSIIMIITGMLAGILRRNCRSKFKIKKVGRLKKHPIVLVRQCQYRPFQQEQSKALHKT